MKVRVERKPDIQKFFNFDKRGTLHLSWDRKVPSVFFDIIDEFVPDRILTVGSKNVFYDQPGYMIPVVIPNIPSDHKLYKRLKNNAYFIEYRGTPMMSIPSCVFFNGSRRKSRHHRG